MHRIVIGLLLVALFGACRKHPFEYLFTDCYGADLGGWDLRFCAGYCARMDHPVCENVAVRYAQGLEEEGRTYKYMSGSVRCEEGLAALKRVVLRTHKHAELLPPLQKMCCPYSDDAIRDQHAEALKICDPPQ